jgi:hypothetical protein
MLAATAILRIGLDQGNRTSLASISAALEPPIKEHS